MGEGMILDDQDTPQYEDGWSILRLAEATGTLGQALAFIRNQRTVAEFKTWLLNERTLNRALKRERWSDPC
jgi:hypothetical protein